jgi:hypothetical protein
LAVTDVDAGQTPSAFAVSPFRTAERRRGLADYGKVLAVARSDTEVSP